MIKRILRIKGILALILVTAFSMSTMGAAVSDNDGSAFITKTEFDSLKSNFQAQIDQYNNNIDSKIDNAIASYLAGIKIITKTDMEIKPYVRQLTFIDQPQWLIGYNPARLTSARSWWGSSRLSGLSYIFSSNSSAYIGVIPLSAKTFSYAYNMSYLNFGFWDSTSASTNVSSIVITNNGVSMNYKVTTQDDGNEFWYVALLHNMQFPSTLSKSVAQENLRPWALVSTVSNNYIIKDWTPYIYIYKGNGALWWANNYFIDQQNWRFADNNCLSSASMRHSVFLSWGGTNVIQFGLKQWNVADSSSIIGLHSVPWNRYLFPMSHTTPVGGLGGYFSVKAFSAYDTIFGGYVPGYGNLPVMSVKNASTFGNTGYEAYGWGSTSLFRLSGTLSKIQSVTTRTWSTLYNSKYNYWNSWSSTAAVGSFPQPYSTLALGSFKNEILYNNGYSELGLCDGLPICGVYNNGYAEIKIKCSTWRIARQRSWSGTSFSWLNAIVRSYDSAKEWRSTLLHISTSPFDNASSNKTTLRLCDSNGAVLGVYAQSIGNSHSYNYNLSYNSSTSRSENEYNVWKVYVPVKKGETIYVKLEPKDPYGLVGVKIVDISVTAHSS